MKDGELIDLCVGLDTTTFGPPHDNQIPIEIGFRVSCDLSCHHPRYMEVLAKFPNGSPTLQDVIDVLELLK